MRDDEIDRLMRGDAARFDASSARADRVAAAVLARLPEISRPRRSLAAWCLTMLAPLTRLAVPMAAAAVLGVIVGQNLVAAQMPLRFAEMLTASSVDLTGL